MIAALAILTAYIGLLTLAGVAEAIIERRTISRRLRSVGRKLP